MATTKLDVSKFLQKMNLSEKAVLQEAQVMLNEAAIIGEEVAKRSLDLAVTKYGQERWGRGQGNSPGRNDTGSMIDNLKVIDGKITPAGSAEIKLGWGRGRSKKYYKYQEQGTAKIRGVFSLFDARTAILNELPRLAKNMKARVSRKVNNT